MFAEKMGTVDETDESIVDNGINDEINAFEAEELTRNGIGAKRGTEREMNGSKPGRLRRYYCKICGLVRSRRELLKRHVMSQHVDRFGREDEVEKFIARKSREEVANDLKERKVTEGEFNSSKPRVVRRYCCRICGFVRERRKRLRLHIMLNHPEKMGSKDEIEGAIEKMYIEDEVSGTTTRDLRRYQCKICGDVRSKRRYMRLHIIAVHPENIGTDEEVNKLIIKNVKEDEIVGSKTRIVTEEDEIDGFEGKKSTKEEINGPIGRDLRRYECKICGLVRSKRKLLELHMLSCHGEVLEEDEDGKHSPRVCDECGVSFKKPSHLQQHKLSHSAARPFMCPIDGCLNSYKRQDHLNRHLLKHEGELFVCPVEDCRMQLLTLLNLKRHVKQHKEKGDSWQSQRGGQRVDFKEMKTCCCSYCGKAFKYPSQLAKHLDDVHSTIYTEVICCEPGCLKYFTNAQALREHVRQHHNHVSCEICGCKLWKSNLKMHMQTHETNSCVKRIQCPYERCLHSYTKKSNLTQHINSVHLGLRPYRCRFDGCGMTFAYKAVRDNHEMSGTHCYIEGDFVEEDAAFQSRTCGGRKRKAFTIDSIFRKKIVCPAQSTALENASAYLDWLISNEGE